MKAIDTIVTALAAGATADFRPNIRYEKHEINEAYDRLKALIQAKYPQVQADLLAVGPGSAERKQAMRQQLEAAGAANDADLLEQAQAVLAEVAENDPEAVWAAKTPEPPPHMKD